MLFSRPPDIKNTVTFDLLAIYNERIYVAIVATAYSNINKGR